uniref:Uncharacterized protein n=1 Tax=Oryza brachyantha TaxID=4533 RepID=J3MEZ7_ORYBR
MEISVKPIPKPVKKGPSSEHIQDEGKSYRYEELEFSLFGKLVVCTFHHPIY